MHINLIKDITCAVILADTGRHGATCASKSPQAKGDIYGRLMACAPGVAPHEG